MSLANISIVGNLVKTPEQIQFDSGNIKTNVLVAVNHANQQGKENTADFYRVELWGKLGDLACKYLHKGNQIAVSGRFQLDRWQDRDGKERVTPVVRATQLSLPPRLKVVNGDEMPSSALHSDLVDDTESTAMVAEEAGVYEFGEAESSCVDEDRFAADAFGDIGTDDEFPKQNRDAPAPNTIMRSRSLNRTVAAV
jgi:single-strand DNA-binding protein